MKLACRLGWPQDPRKLNELERDEIDSQNDVGLAGVTAACRAKPCCRPCRRWSGGGRRPGRRGGRAGIPWRGRGPFRRDSACARGSFAGRRRRCSLSGRICTRTIYKLYFCELKCLKALIPRKQFSKLPPKNTRFGGKIQVHRLRPRHARVPPLPAVERGRAPPGPGR